jgi:hypothetical protein
MGDRGVEPFVGVEKGQAELHEEEGEGNQQQDGEPEMP